MLGPLFVMPSKFPLASNKVVTGIGHFGTTTPRRRRRRLPPAEARRLVSAEGVAARQRAGEELGAELRKLRQEQGQAAAAAEEAHQERGREGVRDRGAWRGLEGPGSWGPPNARGRRVM